MTDEKERKLATRREFVKKAAIGAAAVVGGSALAACTGPAGPAGPAGTGAPGTCLTCWTCWACRDRPDLRGLPDLRDLRDPQDPRGLLHLPPRLRWRRRNSGSLPSGIMKSMWL